MSKVYRCSQHLEERKNIRHQYSTNEMLASLFRTETPEGSAMLGTPVLKTRFENLRVPPSPSALPGCRAKPGGRGPGCHVGTLGAAAGGMLLIRDSL